MHMAMVTQVAMDILHRFANLNININNILRRDRDKSHARARAHAHARARVRNIQASYMYSTNNGARTA